jgi:hypothetical protein
MHPDIYRQYQNRRVIAPNGFVDDLLDSIRQLSNTCKENVLMLEEELVFNDPYLTERCGLLADRFEVFAMTIPSCRGHAFVVSIDLKGENPPPVMMHGVLSSVGKCDHARRLTIRHRKLVNPLWET